MSNSTKEAEVLYPPWPSPLIENFDDAAWPILEESADSIEKWVLENKKLLLRVVTWNLCAKAPPSLSELSPRLLPLNRFHVYIVGTEECERSIAQSAINPSKKLWEAYLMEALGSNYVPIRSHTLQAIHIMAFVHKSIAHMCSFVTSTAVPTGIGSTLGNKGGVAVFIKIGSTKILVVNAHLSAHQNAEQRRNAEFHRINKMIPFLLEKKDMKLKGNTGLLPSPSMRAGSMLDNTGSMLDNRFSIKSRIVSDSTKIDKSTSNKEGASATATPADRFSVTSNQQQQGMNTATDSYLSLGLDSIINGNSNNMLPTGSIDQLVVETSNSSISSSNNNNVSLIGLATTKSQFGLFTDNNSKNSRAATDNASSNLSNVGIASNNGSNLSSSSSSSTLKPVVMNADINNDSNAIDTSESNFLLTFEETPAPQYSAYSSNKDINNSIINNNDGIVISPIDNLSINLDKINNINKTTTVTDSNTAKQIVTAKSLNLAPLSTDDDCCTDANNVAANRNCLSSVIPTAIATTDSAFSSPTPQFTATTSSSSDIVSSLVAVANSTIITVGKTNEVNCDLVDDDDAVLIARDDDAVLDLLSVNNNNNNNANQENNNSSSSSDGIAGGGSNSGKTLEKIADVVVFMGDLNYRIKGNRAIVSSLLKNNMHEVLLNNDQLRWNMSKSLVLNNFTEGPLNFRPTYKYDVGTASYDSSAKSRIPSWTDRILYIPNTEVLDCIAYNSVDEIATSDHRPVYASFVVKLHSYVELDEENFEIVNKKLSPEFSSESQVCSIM